MLYGVYAGITFSKTIKIIFDQQTGLFKPTTQTNPTQNRHTPKQVVETQSNLTLYSLEN